MSEKISVKNFSEAELLELRYANKSKEFWMREALIAEKKVDLMVGKLVNWYITDSKVHPDMIMDLLNQVREIR